MLRIGQAQIIPFATSLQTKAGVAERNEGLSRKCPEQRVLFEAGHGT